MYTKRAILSRDDPIGLFYAVHSYRPSSSRILIIAGGTYVECCKYPYWRRLFGSGLRAALALQHLSPNTELFTYAPPSYADDVRASLAGAGLKGHIFPATEGMRFDWLHPHQLVDFPDSEMKQLPIIDIEAPAVLRFGMLEGSARVQAERVVYSLQNETEGFFENGSGAKELVMVISERELKRMLPDAATPADRIAQVFEHNDYSQLRSFAVLLRNELGDVTLYRRGGAATKVKTYASESYFKIGSGDVLAAAFAHAWLEAGQDLETAADRAARSLAWFIQDGRLPLPDNHVLPTRLAAGFPDRVRILGSETLEMGQLLVATVDWLERQDLELTVELRDDTRGPPFDIATLVLIGARTTLSEVEDLAASSATASRRIVFSNGISKLDALFPGAYFVEDYASALYHLLRGRVA